MPINGKAYSWEDITIQRGGVTLVEAQSVSFSDSSEVNRIYGKGRNPRAWTRGPVEAEGELALTLDGYKKLAEDSDVKEKGIYGMKPFDIVVSFDKGDSSVVTFTLQECLFTERSFEGMETDAEVATVTMPFVILGGINDGTDALVE